MSMNHLRGSLEWALMVALVFGAGAIAQAQDEEAEAEGPVIQIGKADAEAADPKVPPPTDDQRFIASQAVSRTVNRRRSPKARSTGSAWRPGRSSTGSCAPHPCRHSGKPRPVSGQRRARRPGRQSRHQAARHPAPRERHRLARDARSVELVTAEGEKKGQIALEVLRRGERETVFITPEERPADRAAPQVAAAALAKVSVKVLAAVASARVLAGSARVRSSCCATLTCRLSSATSVPAWSSAARSGVATIPNGVSVNIQKQDDQPARITVKRGDETWEVVGDDPESLNQLPEDLRPFVEQMLQGDSRALNFRNFRLRDGEQPPMPAPVVLCRSSATAGSASAWSAWSTVWKSCNSVCNLTIGQRMSRMPIKRINYHAAELPWRRSPWERVNYGRAVLAYQLGPAFFFYRVNAWRIQRAFPSFTASTIQGQICQNA